MWLFLGLDFGSVMGSVMVLCQELSKYYILDRTVLIEYAMAAKNTEIKNSLFQPRRVSLDGAVHDPGVILWTGKVAVIVSKVKENSFLGGGEILLRAGQCPNPFAGFLPKHWIWTRSTSSKDIPSSSTVLFFIFTIIVIGVITITIIISTTIIIIIVILTSAPCGMGEIKSFETACCWNCVPCRLILMIIVAPCRLNHHHDSQHHHHCHRY